MQLKVSCLTSTIKQSHNLSNMFTQSLKTSFLLTGSYYKKVGENIPLCMCLNLYVPVRMSTCNSIVSRQITISSIFHC